jgi:Domain of unknown function (DUF397)
MSTTTVRGVRWRTSRYTNGQGACVEVGQASPAIAVRDTKDREGPELAFSPASWKAFTRRVKNAR